MLSLLSFRVNIGVLIPWAEALKRVRHKAVLRRMFVRLTIYAGRTGGMRLGSTTKVHFLVGFLSMHTDHTGAMDAYTQSGNIKARDTPGSYCLPLIHFT
jgi:hypothetical protein